MAAFYCSNFLGLCAMKAEEVEQLIKNGLPEADVYVEGEDGTHFGALVISTDFAGKSRIQKQQLVYDTVREYLLDGRLHALSLKTFTPDEWQELEAKHHDLGES